MCGRYVLGEHDLDVVEQRFFARVSGHHEFTSRYNVAPSQTMPIVEGEAIRFVPWGYAPSWGKKPVINARIESLTEKSFFRNAVHCLVPATGFYEWKKEGEGKVPYYFHLQNDELFAFAGIYNEKGYAIVTTKAAGTVAAVHDRMPVILTREQEAAWQSGTIEPTEQPLLAHAVSPAVNNPRADTPELIREGA